MDVDENTMVLNQSTTATSLASTFLSLLSTSPMYDLIVSPHSPSTQGRTTAAIIPSLVLSGVDIVIYERIDRL